MAVTIINQTPLYKLLPVGQEVVFVVSNDAVGDGESKVKFIADVHISVETPNLATTINFIGSFKTTPNNAGVGIFDFRNIIENYVKADNVAYYSDLTSSRYKNVTTTEIRQHPLHIIDKYSLNNDSVRNMAIVFAVEYQGATDSAGNQNDNVVRRAANTGVDSDNFVLFNGFLNYSDKLTMDASAKFGYNLQQFNLTDETKSFLTNAPTTQYANIEDYGTLAFLKDIGTTTDISSIVFTYYTEAGATSSDVIENLSASGGSNTATNSENRLLFFGCFPGNLQNWSATFIAAMPTLSYYTVGAFNTADSEVSETYTIHINCPNLKGYESIRLCWINQWGAWDYYTFTKKSVKTLNTQGSTYTQLQGTWNKSIYQVGSYRGGKKSFRVNSTEKIKINTDFVSENENVMFEELINSPEVYLLDGFQTDAVNAMLNDYVTPVRVISKSFTRKTIANDNLLQYSFEIEKTKTLRTQSI
mgnify:FL=1|tara:strand:- start:3323 stop:4741 length:1419 start_codon:yes stop_codon:yes gene_type:complete